MDDNGLLRLAFGFDKIVLLSNVANELLKKQLWEAAAEVVPQLNAEIQSFNRVIKTAAGEVVVMEALQSHPVTTGFAAATPAVEELATRGSKPHYDGLSDAASEDETPDPELQ